jgi:hypothetical protein
MNTNAYDAATRRQMRQQSLRAPWREVAEACEQMIEWRSFALWVRAIIDAEHAVPKWLTEIIDRRCPGFFEARCNATDHESAWLDLSGWIDNHLFRTARDAGWIDALHYYAGRDPRSERVWIQWTRCGASWQSRAPATYPTFEQWRQEAEDICIPAASDSRGKPREKTSSAPPDRLASLVPAYIEWEAFAFWVRSVVESAREIPAIVARVLDQRCPGFLNQVQSERPKHPGYTTWFWRDLVAWIDSHVFADADNELWLDAIRSTARCHLRAERFAEYWAACSSRWAKKPPDLYPTFEQWLAQADAFVMK